VKEEEGGAGASLSVLRYCHKRAAIYRVLTGIIACLYAALRPARLPPPRARQAAFAVRGHADASLAVIFALK